VLSFTWAEIHCLVIELDLPLYIRCEVSWNFEDCATALCMLLQHLSEFGHVFQDKGAPLDVVAVIIDGTLQKNAQPVYNQRLVFNSWKCMHCLKYHAVLSPDGLLIHVYGPVDGCRHDKTVFKQSGLSDLLIKHFWDPNGNSLYLYGDLGYSIGPHILCPYKGPVLTAEQNKFNFWMSWVQEPIEWIFKEVNQQFEFLDFSWSQTILLTPWHYSTWWSCFCAMPIPFSMSPKFLNTSSACHLL